MAAVFLTESLSWHLLLMEPVHGRASAPGHMISWPDTTIIVASASSALGREAARHFVRLGAKRAILAVRNAKKPP